MIAILVAAVAVLAALVAVLAVALWRDRACGAGPDGPVRPRVVRRPWMDEEELERTLRGHENDPVATGVLNIVSRKEEEFRTAADVAWISAEARAFFNGAACACREIEELVEEKVRLAEGDAGGEVG